MFHEEKGQNGFTVTPKSSFVIGIVSGVLVICTIGFFILLGIVLKGGSAYGSGGNGGGNGIAIQPSNNVPTDTGDQLGTVKEVTKDDHMRGDLKAKVTLIEYSDFECPFCDQFHPTLKRIKDEYGDKINWVYRHYPLSFHPQAVPAANASECAAEQGKFWEYADLLFANQASLGDPLYGKLATDLKLNASKFNDCYTAKKYNAEITADQTSGTTANVTGTPGTIVLGPNGYAQLIPGALPYESVKQMVDAALAN